MSDPAPAVTARQPADAQARALALDSQRSFIVQAPAGSGKTELLIRRLLVLLAHVDVPEEIVALTFTRKAAGEMRARVLTALAGAQDDRPPADAHARETWALARAALARDAALGWALASSPGRLRIQTLDGLCATLVRRMPLLSRLGGVPAVEDDARPLYREAARATLDLLEEGTAEQAAAVGVLLLHLDNRSGAVEDLLVQMLAQRDRWIRHAAQLDAAGDRERLEAALVAARREAFEQVRSMLAPLADRLVALARWAANNLPSDSDSPLRACVGLSALPGVGEEDAACWFGLADLLLTRGGSYRKRVDKRAGFPAPSDTRDPALKRRYEQAKQDFADLVADCERVPGLEDALSALGELPPPRYDDAQWDVLGAVVQVLRLAAAQLEIVFAARGAGDFTAIAQGALDALGSADAPSDLLLSLDARIHHLLIDEFQDTSVTQFELLQRLTAGWSDGDGRTLFLVGDPMQSIYRFREAEVGLFLRARHDGVGGLGLEPLQLSTNFRSARGVVDWVNSAFSRVLPAREDIARGAVPFEPATHWHPADGGQAVMVHAFVYGAGVDNGAATDEAERIAQVIAQARGADPQQSIAVLVRSRSHLGAIVPALRAIDVPLRAVEIETLRQRPVVLDLLALTRALLHPADRIAWLAALRAPWCALVLADLHALAAGEPRRTIWQLLNDGARQAALSEDGRARVGLLVEALRPALADVRRGAMRDAIEGAWLRLSGADCLRGERDLDDARAYLDLLASVARAGDLADLGALETRMERLFAAPDRTDARQGAPVELMTIHKAKGLEFDIVIVPGLHRRPPSGESPLLAWTERPRRHAAADLVLATVPASGVGRDGVHAWIGRLERERERLEAGRLLYVAATRARHRLHLLGSAATSDGQNGGELRAPNVDSLLHPLWPVVRDAFEAAVRPERAAPAADATVADAEPLDPRTWRLKILPPLAADDPRLPHLAWSAPPAAIGERTQVEFSWAGESVRLVGTVVHRWLQRIAADASAWSAERVGALQPVLERELEMLGLPAGAIDGAVQRAITALRTTLGDERGQWILWPRERAASELRLTGVDGGQLVNVAIDRTFIDDGIRWVIDYKTGAHEGEGIDAFLDREVERYRPQLERYARLAAALGPEPVRCGLYFPLFGAWRDC